MVRTTTITLLAVMLLAGCGGTKLIKEPQSVQTSGPLAESCDDRVCAYVDWVIVRNGPGSWAQNATWDEYVLRVNNRNGRDVTVQNVYVVDSLGLPQSVQDNPSRLKRSSSQTVKRYRDHELSVKAGDGTEKMLAAGGAVALTGLGVGVAVGGYGGLAIAAAAPAGILVLAPALVVNKLVRGSQLKDEMLQRNTTFPIPVPANSDQALDIFVPFAPSPRYVEIVYASVGARHTLRIDTRSALQGLHFENGQ